MLQKSVCVSQSLLNNDLNATKTSLKEVEEDKTGIESFFTTCWYENDYEFLRRRRDQEYKFLIVISQEDHHHHLRSSRSFLHNLREEEGSFLSSIQQQRRDFYADLRVFLSDIAFWTHSSVGGKQIFLLNIFLQIIIWFRVLRRLDSRNK